MTNHPFPAREGYWTPIGYGAWAVLPASDPRVGNYARVYAAMTPKGQRSESWRLSMAQWREEKNQ